MISSNASTILPSNMNEKQRLHQEKEAEVGKVAALEAALDAFTVIRNPATTLCHVVSVTLCWEAAHSLQKMAAFKTFKWIVVDGQELLLASTSNIPQRCRQLGKHIDRDRRKAAILASAHSLAPLAFSDMHCAFGDFVDVCDCAPKGAAWGTPSGFP